jgi:hypothetical protein
MALKSHGPPRRSAFAGEFQIVDEFDRRKFFIRRAMTFTSIPRTRNQQMK